MGKLEEEEEEPATERRREYTDSGLDLGERERRASRLPCLSLGLGDDCRGVSRSRNVSLMIFIASVSGGESLTSFTNHFFHFNGPPDFRLAFDAAERNGKVGRIQCQRSKESTNRGKEKEMSIPLQKDSES